MPIVPADSSFAPSVEPQAAPTEAPKNDFSDIVQNMKANDLNGLKQNSFATEELHPDREAEVIKLSDKFKVRPEFIRDHFDDFSKTASAPDHADLADLVDKNPHLTRMMQDPSNMALMKDDLPALKKVEDTSRLLDTPKEYLGAFRGGYQKMESSLYYLGASEGQISPREAAQAIAERNQRAKEFEAQMPTYAKAFSTLLHEKTGNVEAAANEFFGTNYYEKLMDGQILDALKAFGSGGAHTVGTTLDAVATAATHPRGLGYKIAEAFPQGIPAIILGKLGGELGGGAGLLTAPVTGPVGPVVGATIGAGGGTFAGFAATGIGGDVENELVKRGVDTTNADQLEKALSNPEIMSEIRTHARRKGLTTAAIAGLFQSAFAGKVSSLATAETSALKTTGLVAADTGIQATGMGAGELGGQMAAGDKPSVGAAFETSLITFGQSFAESQVGHSLRMKYSVEPARAAQEMVSDTNKAVDAEHGVALLRELKHGVDEAKLTQRLPEKIGELVDNVAKTQGTDRVFYQKDDWDNYFRGKNLSPAKAAEQVMGDGGKAYHEAEQTGADLEVPLDKFATEIAPTDHFDGLLPITKTKADGMTFDQASEHMKELPGVVSQLSKEASGVEAHPEAQGQLDEIRRIKAEELVKIGQTPEEAAHNSEIISRSIGRIAQEQKLSPVQVLEKFPLSFQQEAPEGGFTLKQEDINSKFGQINFKDNEAVVTIFNKDNPTTTMHEFSHYVMNTLGSFVKEGSATPELTAMHDTLLKHVGAESFDAMTEAQHENLARSWEAYIFKGESPSRNLRQTFSQMKQWFLDTYRSLKSFMATHGVSLPKDVTEVFDRLVATDDELAKAKKDQAINALFDKPEELGMTENQAREYKRAIQDADDAAYLDLVKKTMKFIEKKNTKEFNDRLNVKKEEVAKQLNEQPNFVAKSILESGKLPDGTRVEEMKGLKLSRKSIVDDFGEEALNGLPEKAITKSGKLSPDEAADIFGFSSGDELLAALRTTPENADVINSEAEQRAREESGDLMLDPNAVQDAAIEAVQSSERSVLMQKEIEHMVSDSFATFKKLVKKLSGRIPVVEETRAFAEDQISGESVGQLRPSKYKMATAKASKEAMDLFLKGDFQGALDARKRALLANELFRASTNAQVEGGKIVNYMKKFNKDSVRAELGLARGQYLAQIDGLMERFDFAKISNKALEERKSLVDWVEDQHRQGYDTQVPEKLLNEAYKTNYKELSMENLRAVFETASQIKHLADLKNQLISTGEKRDFVEATQAIVAKVAENYEIKQEPAKYSNNKLDNLVEFGKGAAAQHARPEYIFKALDGHEFNGPAWREMFLPISLAEDHESVLTREAVKAREESFSEYSKAERAMFLYKKVFIPEINASLNKMNLFVLGLNRGSRYNHEAVMEGEGWSREQYDAALSHLDERDWRAIQKIWKNEVNVHWDAAKALEIKMNGLAPEKVEGEKFTTKYGEIQGEYYPIVFDKKRNSKQFQIAAEQETKDMFGGQWARAYTKQGHLQERTNSGGKAISLDMSGLNQHLANVIHDITHREAVIDVSKLINSKEVTAAIEGSLGKDIYRQLQPWINRVAGSQRVEAPNFVEGLLSKARSGATVVGLGYNFGTALKHSVNILAIADEVGGSRVAKATKDVFGSFSGFKEAHDFIMSRSETMRNRYTDLDRDLKDYSRKSNITGQDTGITSIAAPYMAGVKESFFHVIGWVDKMTSMPGWLAAYGKAMEGGQVNIKAGDEHAAIQYADAIIRTLKGSGNPKDLANIQAHNETFKIFTMFYGPMSLVHNQYREIGGRYAVTKNKAQLISSLFYRWFLPSMIMGGIAGHGPKEDEDNQGKENVKWAGKKLALYPLESVIGVRDFASAMERKDFSASPVFQVADTFLKTGKSLGSRAFGDKDEFTANDYHSMFNTTGYVLELPTAQLWKSGDYLYDWMTGDQQPKNAAEGIYRTLVIGKPKQGE